MIQRAAITFAGASLALVLWSMTAYSQGNKAAQQDVLKLMDSIRGKKGNVKAQTAAIKKKFEDLEPIMQIYKLRKKGGLGTGKDGDDIEVMIGKVGNAKAKGWTPKKRLDMRADLAKIAELSRAMAEVADLYPKNYNDNNTGKPAPAKWKKYVKEMARAPTSCPRRPRAKMLPQSRRLPPTSTPAAQTATLISAKEQGQNVGIRA